MGERSSRASKSNNILSCSVCMPFAMTRFELLVLSHGHLTNKLFIGSEG